MIRSLFFLLCFIPFTIFSQKKADTLRLYFNINEITSVQNNLRLDSALKAIDKKSMDVGIFGYADFLSNDSYNISLSQKRADNVKQYLLDNAAYNQLNVYACEGKGESFSKDNSSAEGEPKQRRVDIYFEPIVVLNVAESFLETPKEEATKTEPKKTIEELSKGETMAIEGLSFVPGRHLILESAVPVLQKLLKTMKNNPKLKIEIQGHVCCTNGTEDGLDYDTRERNLSESRAKTIYEYLVAKGISKDRLSYKGFGHSKPKELNEDSPLKEQANRRVEILILEN
ncbi:MAG: OmpA family protein [Bacteroidia bacterium]|nr:OmpA family protein [Bacteroidia bacterium]